MIIHLSSWNSSFTISCLPFETIHSPSSLHCFPPPQTKRSTQRNSRSFLSLEERTPVGIRKKKHLRINGKQRMARFSFAGNWRRGRRRRVFFRSRRLNQLARLISEASWEIYSRDDWKNRRATLNMLVFLHLEESFDEHWHFSPRCVLLQVTSGQFNAPLLELLTVRNWNQSGLKFHC